jgi:hypothetical protein
VPVDACGLRSRLELSCVPEERVWLWIVGGGRLLGWRVLGVVTARVVDYFG